ncbi:MAG: GNAT family N-acetyltransferase, partial [Gammaproteobacteria bacterium]
MDARRSEPGSWSIRPFDSGEGTFWERWDACLARFFGAHAMLDARFLQPLVEAFGHPDLQVLTAGPDDDPDVMMIVECRRRGVYNTFMPAQLQVAPVLCRPGLPIDVTALFSALPASWLRFDFFNVDPLYFGPGLVPSDNIDAKIHAVTTNVDAARPFEEFWSVRPKKLRDNVKRYRKRADEDGLAPHMLVHEEPAAVLAALHRYGELESRGWKGRVGTAVSSSNEQGEFYAEVLSRYAEVDGAAAFELYFGEFLVASRLVIKTGGMAILLKTTFDEAYARFAPGRIAFHAVLEALFAAGDVKIIETYTNAQREQIDWADRSREVMNYSAYRYASLRRGVTFTRRAFRPGSVELNFSIATYDDFGAVPKTVAKLWEEYGERKPFASSEWFRNLHEHVGHDLGEMCVITLLNRAEEVHAILPCVKRSATGRSCEYLSLANYYTPSFEPIVDEARISRDEAIQRILGALALRDDWDALTLFPLHDSPDLAAFRAAAKRNLLACATFDETANWTQEIDDLESYRASLPATLRSTLARKQAKLAREGEGRFEVISAPREAAAAAKDFNLVYRSSWKPEEPYEGFIDGLVALASRQGWLRLGLLYIGGR